MANRRSKKKITPNSASNQTKKAKKRKKSDTLSLWAVVISAISLIYTIASPIITKHFEEMEHISVINTRWDTATVLKYSHNDGSDETALEEASYIEGFLFSTTLSNHSSKSVIISDYSCKMITPLMYRTHRMTFIDSTDNYEKYGGIPISIDANDIQQITFVMRYYIPDEVDDLLFEEYGYNAEVAPPHSVNLFSRERFGHLWQSSGILFLECESVPCRRICN